ncbi:MAG: riboflavin synthase [Candidatus Omnitrophica bacterium]|nr:riboflavin synthase [Candidatus Omnitrophota bacterium]
MFTGIIEEVGKISRISKRAGYWQIGVISKVIFPKVEESASVSVNGVCLTLIKKEKNILYFDLIKASLDLSNLKRLKISDCVNLESGLSLGGKLDGHFVLGHIDCEEKIKRIWRSGGNVLLEIAAPPKFKKYLVSKGSIALDGISLTVAEVKSGSFSVNIIPYTWQNTGLKNKKAGSYINVEFDYLAKVALNR